MHLLAKLPVELSPKSSYIGHNDLTLGAVGSGQYHDFSLTVQPTRLGLVKVSPLILINTIQKREYTIEKVVDVFVIDEEYEIDEILGGNNMHNVFVSYDRGFQRVAPESGPMSSLHSSAI